MHCFKGARALSPSYRRRYEVDTVELRQKNLKTGFKRPVCRIVHHVPSKSTPDVLLRLR